MARRPRTLTAAATQSGLTDRRGVLGLIAERVVEVGLAAETMTLLGEEPYERRAAHAGNRSGHKSRYLNTRMKLLFWQTLRDRAGTIATTGICSPPVCGTGQSSRERW